MGSPAGRGGGGGAGAAPVPDSAGITARGAGRWPMGRTGRRRGGRGIRLDRQILEHPVAAARPGRARQGLGGIPLGGLLAGRYPMGRSPVGGIPIGCLPAGRIRGGGIFGGSDPGRGRRMGRRGDGHGRWRRGGLGGRRNGGCDGCGFRRQAGGGSRGSSHRGSGGLGGGLGCGRRLGLERHGVEFDSGEKGCSGRPQFAGGGNPCDFTLHGRDAPSIFRHSV